MQDGKGAFSGLSDDLDLYDYAAAIGDFTWQENIMDKFKQNDAYIEPPPSALTDEEFNRLLLAIAKKIEEVHALMEQEKCKVYRCDSQS